MPEAPASASAPIDSENGQGTVFGVPVTALNYSHAAYHGAEDCVMSVIFAPDGDVMAVAYTAPYKKTSKIVENMDGGFERQEVVSDAGDPVFTQTWRNVVNMTVSLGEYRGRNVFLVSDINRMIDAHAWQ